MDKITMEALAYALHITEMLVATSGQAATAILMDLTPFGLKEFDEA